MANSNRPIHATRAAPTPVKAARRSTSVTPIGKPLASSCKVALLEIETVPENQASLAQRQHVAKLLGLPQDEVPPLRIKWCHLRQDATGELIGSCPKMPSDLAAKIGVHIDTKHPDQSEEVFGSLRLTTTDLNLALGRQMPLGNSTHPGNTQEGTEFIPHRSQLAVPVRHGQT